MFYTCEVLDPAGLVSGLDLKEGVEEGLDLHGDGSLLVVLEEEEGGDQLLLLVVRVSDNKKK